MDGVLDRFWAKVKKSDGCWEWTAYQNRAGYGRFGNAPGKTMLAHRFSYELENGPIPGGLVIDHLCRNAACVNPKHMEAVTQRVNVARGMSFAVENSAKENCPRGHAYDYVDSHGARRCRRCQRELERMRYRAKSDARMQHPQDVVVGQGTGTS